MKTTILGITLLALSLVSCSQRQTEVSTSEPVVVYASMDISGLSQLEQLEHSLANWDKLTQRRGTSYQYTRRSSSSWGDIKSETIIKVKEDFVISRRYYVVDDENVMTLRWEEEGFDAINDHPKGAPTKIIDDLYDDCKSMLSTKNDVTLTFDSSGILATCHAGKRGIFIENLFFL